MIATKKTSAAPSPVPARRPISRSRRRLFGVMAAALPLLLLATLEGGLRLFGYGHDYRLFVEDPRHRGFWVMNPRASEKYFTVQDNATVGNAERFRMRKEAGTFRVFVLGESTTIGYPYLHNGSFHRWLQYRLVHTFPEKNFEVINVSLTAVNSYTVLGFGREVVDYAPDAVLIYTGHNEYYGALGVGSTSYLGRNPYLVRLVLKLRELRLMQLIARATGKLGALFSGGRVDTRETLMQRMAAAQQIPLHSPVYRSGIHQFETNLGDLLRLLSDRRVPVFLSTLVSNEKDLKPFISAAGPPEQSAARAFERAGHAYRQGDFGRAKKLYARAKELDLLRFRAPEAINQTIARLAPRYPNVHLVDARAAFESHSPHGIPGAETLLEHVHPNLHGYALLSDAFYAAMQHAKVVEPRPAGEMSLAQLRTRMPITPVDSLKGAYEIMMLKEGWPFNVPMPKAAPRAKTFEEQLAGALAVKQLSWGEAMLQLQRHYLAQGQEAAALRVAEALVLEYAYDPAYPEQAGKLCMNLDQPGKAVFYLKKSFGLENSFATAKSLFVTLLKLDRPEEALVYLDYAAAHNASATPLNELQGLVRGIVGLKKAYAQDSARVPLSNQLAKAYLQFANAAAARKYVDNALRLDPGNAEALSLRAQLQAVAR